MAVTVDEMAGHWKRREDARRARADARAQRLIDLLPDAKRLLAERFGARRVILFGSLARGTPNETSDVDLAVAGISPESYFTAISELVELFDCHVDLVEIENAPESLRARLRLEGREL